LNNFCNSKLTLAIQIAYKVLLIDLASKMGQGRQVLHLKKYEKAAIKKTFKT
jgi:hypothetical protein